MVAFEVVWKVPRIFPIARRFQFVALAVDLAAGHIAKTAGMVEMQVTEKYSIDVRGCYAEPGKPGRQSLVLAHIRRAESEHGRVVPLCAFLRIGDLGVIAADVVKNAAVDRLDQIGEDGRIDHRAGAAIACREGLFVTVRCGQQRPEFAYRGHATILPASLAATRLLLDTEPKIPPSTAIMRSAASCRSRYADAQASPTVMQR